MNLTSKEWAEVFRAGWEAIPGKSAQAGDALGCALNAMEKKCQELHRRDLDNLRGYRFPLEPVTEQGSGTIINGDQS